MSTAEDFWKEKNLMDLCYLENFWNIRKKLSYDIEAILPYVRTSKKIGDICCGTGSLVALLDSILRFDRVYLSDINKNALFEAMERNYDAVGRVCNLNNYLPGFVTDCDTILFMGALNYIIDDNRVKQIFDNLKHTKLILRTPCSNENDDKYFCDYTENMGGKYEANYRTPINVAYLLSKSFKHIESKHLYPPELQSKYNTQHLFISYN